MKLNGYDLNRAVAKSEAAGLESPISPSMLFATPWPEWFDAFGMVDCYEQFPDVNIERFRQPSQCCHCRVAHTALQVTHVGPFNIGAQRKIVLGNLSGDAQPPYIPSNEFACIHAGKQALESSLNHVL